ncbi:autotransporter assembly complex protein TamA [Novosphingobium album (ex Liu et al. 2023)]|nr:BamA/TamA family outer membrane protein [Novosphingobium album (ex Liu et al. 2023)]
MRGVIGAGFLSLALCAVQSRAQEAPGSPPADPDALEAGTLPVPPLPPGANLPAVDPVIPDSEFNAAIPPLDANDDAELDRPLESITDFERRLAADQAGVAPTEGQAAPLGDPALADGDATEEVGDAPVRDAELTAPLPSIDQFEVAPVQFAEDASDEQKDAEVAYRTQIDGLDLADKETDAGLKSQFNSLSALKSGDGKAANVAMVSARLNEDSELVRNVLASEGWFDPVVRARIDRSAVADGPPLTAVIAVTPGKRYALAGIVVQADPTDPPGLIADNLALKVGEPIVAPRIQGAEAQVALALPQNGYPFAEVGQRDILLDRDTGGGVYTLPVTVGPKARYGGFETEGNLAFDARHVAVLARFDRGELYDSREIDDLRKALVATGLFSTISVEPRRTGQPAGDGTEYVTVHVNQNAGPPRTIAGSAGYAAGQGFTLEGTWTHRNMFPPEGALIAHGIAGTQEQGAGVTFRRSNAGRRDRTFEVVAEALHSNYDAYSAYTGRLAARISRDSTPIWQKRWTYAYGVQLLGTAEKDYDFTRAARNRRTFYIGGLTGQLGYDRTDDLLDPTRGFRLTALVEPEGSLGDGFNPYVRARIDASGYYPVGDSLVLAGRVRFGTIQGASRFDIAPSRRFYSGGGGSVRGFGYQKLGPLDPNGDPIGGRSLNEAAAEVRYRFGNFGVVGFVDAGQSYAATMPRFTDLRYGVGIGGRFYTNFGPLRVDVATPIDRRPGEARFNLYVSIGQAF